MINTFSDYEKNIFRELTAVGRRVVRDIL